MENTEDQEKITDNWVKCGDCGVSYPVGVSHDCPGKPVADID